MSKNFDTIVIGSGVGGMGVANGVAAAGKKVAIIENNLWGGTCPNRGCDPKKILVSAAETKNKITRLIGKGFSKEPEINWPDLMAFKESYTDSVPSAFKKSLESADVKTVDGTAEFVDPHTILVNGEKFTAENFVIATGAKPFVIPIEGNEYFLTSDEFLSLQEMPKKITFVGAGYIAFEFAAVASAAGAEVHIVQNDERPLEAFDKELVDTVIKQLEAHGVTFHYNIESEKIEKKDDSFILTDEKGFTLTSDLIFCFTGRIPNIEDLKLENAGVLSNRKGIEVNDYLQTSTESIFACGDVTTKMKKKLTPIAMYEGAYLASYLLGETTDKINYPVIPTTVFTSPKMAQTGLSLSDLSEEEYEVSSFDATSWYTYHHTNEPVSKIKMITDRKTGLLVGASCVNEEAEDLINYLSLLIDKEVSAEEVSQLIFAYPSVASDLPSLYS